MLTTDEPRKTTSTPPLQGERLHLSEFHVDFHGSPVGGGIDHRFENSGSRLRRNQHNKDRDKSRYGRTDSSGVGSFRHFRTGST